MLGSVRNPPSIRRRSERTAFVLLGLRLLLAADLTRLLLRRWNALDSSLRTLEVEGFPAPELWLFAAMAAGSIASVTLLVGWRVRWGAALALLFFMPVATIFSVSYAPTGWGPWIGSILPLAAMTETLLLGLALLGLFLFGAGTYTLARGLRTAGRVFPPLSRQATLDGTSASPKKQTDQR